MTLQEYKNQTEPTRQSIGSVILEKGEYSARQYGKDHYIDIPWGDNYLRYVTQPLTYTETELIILYRVDEDMNPMAPSVFSVRTKDLI